MNASIHVIRKGPNPCLSYWIWIMGVMVTSGLCLGQPIPGKPSPPRRRNAPVKIVQLSPPSTGGTVTLEQALLKQNTLPGMTPQPLAVTEIGQIAWAAATGTALVQPWVSPGSEDTLQLYVVVSDGLYRYAPNGHYLEQVSQQGMLGALGMSVMPQQTATGCVFLMTVSSRTRSGRSDSPARRAMLLETGQRMQNLRLQATALDLAVAVPQQFDGPAMARAVDLPRNTEILFVLFAGYRAGQTAGSQGTSWTVSGPGQSPKKVALIVAERGFQDEELFETSRVLNAAGVVTIVVSSRTGPVTGMLGKTAQASVALTQLRVDDVDAVVFVGGTGAVEYVANPVAQGVARDTLAKGKILAAISVAPTVLANAGLVKGVRMTALETERDALVKAGAIFTGNTIERDRLLITANGPLVSTLFGQAIVEALQGR
jgi:protease I